MHYAGTCRESLALLGNIASPIQSCWIYSTLAQCAPRATTRIDRGTALASFKDQLVTEAKTNFLVQTQQHTHIQILGREGSTLALVSPMTTTVGQLLQADRIELDWGHIQVITGPNGPVHHEDVNIPGGAYLLEHIPKKQRREQPTGQVVLAIHHQGEYHIVHQQAGHFLFEALQALDIHQVDHLVDFQLQYYGKDHRAWRSLSLTTVLRDAAQESHNGKELVAKGTQAATPSAQGLNDLTLTEVARQITQASNLADPAVVITPHQVLCLLNGTEGEATQILQELHAMDAGLLLCVVWHDGHWSLLAGDRADDEDRWRYYDGLGHTQAELHRTIATRISTSMGQGRLRMERAGRYIQTQPHTCGTITLAHLCIEIGIPGAFTDTSILQMHTWLNQNGWASEWRANGPPQSDLMKRLAQLLEEKGVPRKVSAERAQTTWDKLGAGAVMQAMAAKNPWQSLKGAANRPQVMFRLITAEELSQHVQDRAATKYGADATALKSNKKTGGGKGQSKGQRVTVDTNMLQLYPGTFVDDQDDEVKGIDFDQVTADVRGVAVCNAAQAHQFIKNPGHISTDALALALIDLPDEETCTNAGIKKVTFPAQHRRTDEPLLFYGGILQLGDTEVTRAAMKTSLQVDTVENIMIVKIQAFRDTINTPWGQFCASPVKDLVHAIPSLRLCPGNNCGKDCPFSHAPVGQAMDGAIMDLWGRSYTTLEGRRVSDQDAEVFTVFLRVPTVFARATLETIVQGIFIEPRSGDHRGPHEDYTVVWIPGIDYEGALHQAKTYAKTVGIARIRHRYGIRVASKDEEAAFKALRPGTPYLDVKVPYMYQLFPLPHGTQRAAISKLLEEWKWRAKPIQPGRGRTDAMAWIVGSEDAPPGPVLHAFDQDVLITEHRMPKKQEQKQEPVIPRKTQRLLIQDQVPQAQTKGTDPFQDPAGDPWGKFLAKNTPVPSAAGASGNQRIEKLATELRAEVTSTVKQELSSHAASVPAITGPTEKKLAALESSITEIKAQNTQFSKWFKEWGARSQETDKAVHQLQQSIAKTQQDNAQLAAAVKQNNDTLHQELKGSIQAIKSDLDSTFDKRFDRLEALVAKRQRTDQTGATDADM